MKIFQVGRCFSFVLAFPIGCALAGGLVCAQEVADVPGQTVGISPAVGHSQISASSFESQLWSDSPVTSQRSFDEQQWSEMLSSRYSGEPATTGDSFNGMNNDGVLRFNTGVDWLTFRRGAAGDFVYLSDDLGSEVSHSDLDFSGRNNIRFKVGLTSQDGTGFEFFGYDFDDFFSDRIDDGPGVTPNFFGGIPRDPASSYTTTYESRFKSFELNAMLRKTDRLRVGLGIRHFNLDEKFDVVDTGTVNGFFSRTDNDLYGVQLLIEKRRPIVNGVNLELGLRGGMFNNNVDVDAVARNVETSQSANTFALMGSVIGGFNFRISEGIALRGGYEAIFLNGIALAPDQSNAIDVFSPTNDFATGAFFIGGTYLGATIMF